MESRFSLIKMFTAQNRNLNQFNIINRWIIIIVQIDFILISLLKWFVCYSQRSHLLLFDTDLNVGYYFLITQLHKLFPMLTRGHEFVRKSATKQAYLLLPTQKGWKYLGFNEIGLLILLWGGTYPKDKYWRLMLEKEHFTKERGRERDELIFNLVYFLICATLLSNPLK